jgi:hypothetical protein
MPGLPSIDLLTVEGGILEDCDHLFRNRVALVGQIDELCFERGIGRIISLECSRGDARKRLDAEFAGRRIDCLIGFSQIGQRLLMPAQRVGQHILVEDFKDNATIVSVNDEASRKSLVQL